MYISAETLDDVLRRLLPKLLKSKTQVAATRGKTREIFGVLLHISNPRARLSRTEKKGTLFSCLGELLWYLARTNDLGFISYYAPQYRNDSEDGLTIRGAYGPRLYDLRGNDQIANIIRLLRKHPSSRRAVIQIFDADDLSRDHREVPCTCTLQFVVRSRRLDMLSSMRSNDAIVGLPHDVFAFTMIQEIVARALNISLGSYRHVVGSMHLYSKDVTAAREYLKEGWQPKVAMPRMPLGNPMESITRLLRAEGEIRRGGIVNLAQLDLDPYWRDLGRLLQIYKHFRNDERERIASLKGEMKSRVYDPYIEKKRQTAPKPAPDVLKPPQLSFMYDRCSQELP